MRQPHLVGPPTVQLPGHLAGNLAEHGRERLGHRHHPVTQQQCALVDPTLRIGLEPRGIQPRPTLRLPADDEASFFRGEHRRRHRRRTLHLHHARLTTMGRQHGDRVGRAEIYRQH
jgi:hypothetical protein